MLETTLIVENVLSRKECNRLIQIFEQDWDGNYHRDTFQLLPENSPNTKHFDDAANKIALSFLTVQRRVNVQPYYYHIVKWPVNSFQPFHTDNIKIRHLTTFTSITYLNDTFSGGETVIDGIQVKPKTGRTVYFDGILNSHAVNKVTEGTRYTFPIWYKFF